MLPLLLACAHPVAKDPGTTGGVDDTGAGPAARDITWEVSPYVTTVVTVRWTTESPGVGHVEFGETEAYGHVTPATEAGTSHEVRLLGMPPDTDVHFRVVTEDWTSEDLQVTTGSLPSGLGPIAVTGETTGYVVMPLQGTAYAVAIVDAQGRYVWWHQEADATGNLMRAFLSRDGESVVYCYAGPQDALEESRIVRVSLDGSEVTETSVPYLDHDLVEHPDGTLAGVRVDERELGKADAIVEIDPDGDVTEVFNAWDAWDPEELGVLNEENWTHANALDHDPVEDVYYLSMRTLAGLAKIDRATGDVLWVMNGRLNEFDFGSDRPVSIHHQFEVLDGSILFFENGPDDRQISRALEVSYDAEARTASHLWTYVADPPLYVFAKGDVERLDDGTTQVVWSSAGQIQRVTPDGEVTWQVDLDLGQAVTFVQAVDSLYAADW